MAGRPVEIALPSRAGVDVTWVYRGGRADLVGNERASDHAPLVAAVTQAQWLPGQVQVFIHGRPRR